MSPTDTEFEFELVGQGLRLLPERAIFWPSQATLFIADPHWGKDSTFRAAAIAIPHGTLDHDLKRLSQAVYRTNAARLIILGDLFHARTSLSPRTCDLVSQWRARHLALEIILVRGNHDERAGDPPANWGFECQDAPMVAGPFILQHIPSDSVLGYTLAGHIHPGVRIAGKGRQQLTLPCFWFGTRIGVLPAFGSFTGIQIVTPIAGDEVCVIAEDRVICFTQR